MSTKWLKVAWHVFYLTTLQEQINLEMRLRKLEGIERWAGIWFWDFRGIDDMRRKNAECDWSYPLLILFVWSIWCVLQASNDATVCDTASVHCIVSLFLSPAWTGFHTFLLTNPLSPVCLVVSQVLWWGKFSQLSPLSETCSCVCMRRGGCMCGC